jgi:M6 family metalloprotease-like protein
MKKILMIMLSFIGVYISMKAVPAQNKPIVFVQGDNTSICLRLWGDENYHFYSTLDSIPVFKTNSGFCYGLVESDVLQVSSVLAHERSERTASESAFVERNTPKVVERLKYKREEAVKENTNRFAKSKRRLGTTNTYIGSKKGLVILVEFANLSMNSTNSKRDFDRLFNEVGYSENYSVGSVHDYFYDQSYGKFDLTFDVVGPVRMVEKYGYYGTNYMSGAIDMNVREMVVDACQMVDDQVDFSDYDWNGDGEVDQVFIIYAGYGEHAGAPDNTIWPHESQLSSYNIDLNLDGVKINTYACSCELAGTTGTIYAGIGTACHEFCHCLGFPDVYDTDYSGAFGMSYWDVMNSGSHSGPNGYGEIPYGFTAYERWTAGWIEPIELENTQHISGLSDLSKGGDAYVVYNRGNRNEFYMLENHQCTKWYQYVGKCYDIHGMLITHIDYDANAWRDNIVNPDSRHQRMSIIPADNSYGSTELEYRGDVYPGAFGVTWLTNSSHQDVGGKLFNENIDHTFNMNCAIGNIVEDDFGYISFDAIFDDDLPAPQFDEVTELDESGYTLNWNSVDNADYYVIEQRAVDMTNMLSPIVKKETYDYVNGTSLRVNWLLPKANTTVRIKSVLGEVNSQWSDNLQVKSLQNGVLEPECNYSERIEFYDITGLRHNELIKGVNIVIQNGKASKILVK